VHAKSLTGRLGEIGCGFAGGLARVLLLLEGCFVREVVSIEPVSWSARGVCYHPRQLP